MVGLVLIGQPADKDVYVGAAVRKGLEVAVNVFSGFSVLSPGSNTGAMETIGRVLSPLAQSEVGTICCIGLNVCLPSPWEKSKSPSWG